jgi:D-aminopeptidase
LPPGPLNAITDVAGVRVGHVTLLQEDGPVRTGVTAVLPHGGNLFREKVAAAVHVINAFGKAVGTTQVAELGVIETPVVLTNTLSIGAAFEGVVRHALRHNPEIGRGTGSVNPLVAECNDSYLNDIRGLCVRPEHVLEAIEKAAPGPVREGVVGAGTGMSCYGWKGGIGTASRRVDATGSGYTLGVLVLANFGRAVDLVIDGVRVGETITPPRQRRAASPAAGSCIVLIATDAPTTARQLGRLARRAQTGLARTGSFGEHGSGEYAVAWSTARTVPHWPAGPTLSALELAEDGPAIDALFQAVVEATEEAVINALFTANTLDGRDGHIRHDLPVEEVLALLKASAGRR